MVRLVNAALIAATVLGSVSLVRAESVLTTPPMYRPGTPLACLIVNAGKGEVTGWIDVVSNTGDVYVGPTGFALGPNTIASNAASASGPFVLYCRFTLTKGSKNAVRAQACILSTIDFSGPCVSTA